MYKNDIFRLFESKIFFENMLQNAPNCTIQKEISGKHAPKPPSKRMATPRVASHPPPPKKAPPPLANPAYAHELLLRNLFENPPWQTVDSV